MPSDKLINSNKELEATKIPENKEKTFEGNKLTKVYRSGEKKDNMFYVSTDKEYVQKHYANMRGNKEVQEFYINFGNILDLTDINYQNTNIKDVIKSLKNKGVKFTEQEESKLLLSFKSTKSTLLKTVYNEMPLWQFINFNNEIADASKRSGFDSIKQFETSGFATGPNGSDWDWSNQTLSYFILNNLGTSTQ